MSSGQTVFRQLLQYLPGEFRGHHTQYQRMIRQLLDTYADLQSEQRSARSTSRAKKLHAG